MQDILPPALNAIKNSMLVVMLLKNKLSKKLAMKKLVQDKIKHLILPYLSHAFFILKQRYIHAIHDAIYYANNHDKKTDTISRVIKEY